jgi:broad specificity phosphatase PhoE
VTSAVGPIETGRMPLDLFFVRHGESEGNIAREAAKRGDRSLMTEEFRARPASGWRLTPEGCKQAQEAGAWLRGWMDREDVRAFDRYYCSPLVRTMETAAHLKVPEARWQLEPLLRERDFGLWEGLDPDESRSLFPRSSGQKQRDRFLWRPECGESTPDLDLRTREMFATFARELAGRRVICVTHEDVMLAVRFRLEKYTIPRWLELDDDADQKIVNCGILHYTRRNPEDGNISSRFGWVRLGKPSSGESGGWQEIQRPRFSNDELLNLVERGLSPAPAGSESENKE